MILPIIKNHLQFGNIYYKESWYQYLLNLSYFRRLSFLNISILLFCLSSWNKSCCHWYQYWHFIYSPFHKVNFWSFSINVARTNLKLSQNFKLMKSGLENYSLLCSSLRKISRKYHMVESFPYLNLGNDNIIMKRIKLDFISVKMKSLKK